jgi:hypothetical protein
MPSHHKLLMGQETMDETIPSRLCGRPFDAADLAGIRHEIALAQPPLRAEIVRWVCQMLSFRDVFGHSKFMSAQLVLLETCVETPRTACTCYRAANGRDLGETTGRGKAARTHKATLPRKAVYVYSLAADFRAALGVMA